MPPCILTPLRLCGCVCHAGQISVTAASLPGLSCLVDHLICTCLENNMALQRFVRALSFMTYYYLPIPLANTGPAYLLHGAGVRFRFMHARCSTAWCLGSAFSVLPRYNFRSPDPVLSASPGGAVHKSSSQLTVPQLPT
ncbi:hypothetical protein F5Y15DRAFT_151837 [Xylariaceae sp. FL0016]|nr:hypothetical protein F5Y15DRAFT_151837 [Xylariaceae sp. FL0016]